MREVGFAVDISNWSGYIAGTHVQRWRRAGVQRVIVGTQNEKVTRQQMWQVYGEKMHLEAYVYLYDNYTAFADQVKEALRRCEGFPVKRLWLDCEFATTSPPDVVVEKIQRAVDACRVAGIPCGIYTRQGWWVPMTGDSDAFADEDLWFASYRISPKPNERQRLHPYVEFGGWMKGLMRQYAGTTDLGGVNVDFNWFEEDVMTEAELREELFRLQIELNTVRRAKNAIEDAYEVVNEKNIELVRENRRLLAKHHFLAERLYLLHVGLVALHDYDADVLRRVADGLTASPPLTDQTPV